MGALGGSGLADGDGGGGVVLPEDVVELEGVGAAQGSGGR